jgi:transcriptional regulator with XRE-family HTH domain
MEKIEEELKDRVFRLRKQAGLSQAELAKRANLSPKMILAIEKGRRGGSVATMKALASSLGVSLEELVGEELPAPRYTPVPVSKIINRIAAVPDEVYELAPFMDKGGWDIVLGIMEKRKTMLHKDAKNPPRF